MARKKGKAASMMKPGLPPFLRLTVPCSPLTSRFSPRRSLAAAHRSAALSTLANTQEEKDYYDDLQMELELADDDKPVMYKLGEAFFSLSLPAAKKQLRADIKRYDGEIGGLREQASECEKGMKELKVLL